jgi:hypothetical protein
MTPLHIRSRGDSNDSGSESNTNIYTMHASESEHNKISQQRHSKDDNTRPVARYQHPNSSFSSKAERSRFSNMPTCDSHEYLKSAVPVKLLYFLLKTGYKVWDGQPVPYEILAEHIATGQMATRLLYNTKGRIRYSFGQMNLSRVSCV